jgi:hypothetical protein
MSATPGEAEESKEGGQARRLIGFGMSVDAIKAMVNEGASSVGVEHVVSLKPCDALRTEELKASETKYAGEKEDVRPAHRSTRRLHQLPKTGLSGARILRNTCRARYFHDGLGCSGDSRR